MEISRLPTEVFRDAESASAILTYTLRRFSHRNAEEPELARSIAQMMLICGELGSFVGEQRMATALTELKGTAIKEYPIVPNAI